ncbi:TonB-dependent receptor domain-containing protein [Roseibium sp.]|uniref:TonB-dependent receptor domain-containing protein n=1 Tax=Roseibium sp. TaxID=1936156 RepID=UPI003A97BF85
MSHHARMAMLLAGTVIGNPYLMLQASAQEQGVALDQIVIQAADGEIATDVPRSETTVTLEEIDQSQVSSFAELLKSIPGVSIAGSSSPAGQAINIRGFGSQGGTYGSDQRVAIQIDGVANGGDELYRLGSQVFTDPELYKEVKVFRGPAGTGLYSTGAIGGAVIATTKDAGDFLSGDDRFALRQKVDYFSNGDGITSSTILAIKPLENFELLGSFNYRYSDVQTDGAGDDITGSDFGAPSGLLKGKYTFGESGEHSVGATYQYYEAKQTDVPFAALNPASTSFGFIDRDIKDSRINFDYGYNPVGNDLIDFSLTFGYALTQIDQYNSRSSPSVSLTEADYENRTFSFRAENKSHFISGPVEHSLIYGFDGSILDRLSDYNGSPVSSAPEGTSRKIAAFVQDEMRIYERFKLIPTIRLEYQSIEPGSGTTTGWTDGSTNIAWAPSLEALYELKDHFNVFGSVAYTDRLPTVDELFATSVTTELEPETAISYEAGVSYDQRHIFTDADVAQAKFTVFQNNIKNMIDGGSQADEARVEGVEIEARYDAGRFYTTLTHSHMRGYDLSGQYGGEYLPYIPADETRIKVGTRFEDYNLDLSWEAVFAASQERVPSSAGGLTATKGYALHNFKTVWSPDEGLLEGTNVVFGIDNVFDREYREYLSTQNGAGRTFKLSLAKTF